MSFWTNGSVATHFILLSSTAASSSTVGKVIVLERFGQNEEPAGSIKERTWKKPNFVPKVDLNDAMMFLKCNHKPPLFFLSYLTIDEFFNIFLLGNFFWSFCLYYFLWYRREDKHFVVHSWRIRPVLFPSKDGKDAAYEGRNGWKGVFFPPESAFSVFWNIMIEVPFPICTLTWRVNNRVYRQIKGVNRRNESTILLWSIHLLLCIKFWWYF